MSLILSGTDGLSDVDGSAATPAIRGTDANTGMYFPAANQVALASNGTLALLVDGSQNITLGSGVTVNAFQGTSPSNGVFMGTVGGASFFLANQTSTNTNLYLSKASGYSDASLVSTYVNGVLLGGLRVSAGNTAMNLYGVSGITFPATQIASADANTLDDYEEGTWTPSVGGNTSGSFSVTAQNGSYVKTGQMCVASFFISFTKSTASGGGLTVGNLPFTASAVASAIYPELAILFDNLATTLVNPLAQVQYNNTVIDIIANNGSTASHAALPINTYCSASNMALRGTVVYRTAS
jgi:hypothetical protein